MIKASYNFVPLNEKVFFPDWADKVSHDVPFRDGESGCITIKLTAKSPVYVRNGGAWSKDNQINNQNPDYTSFSELDNQYFIPGTSLKGMIRSVLEVMSFGKMGKGRINNSKYSFRDLSNADYRGEIIRNGRPQVKAGWLKENSNGSWQIVPCDFARVNFSDLEKYYKNVTSEGKINFKEKIKNYFKNAVDKYEEWGTTSLDVNFDAPPANDPVNEHWHESCHCYLWYQLVNNLGAGSQIGKLVFTGQPSARKHMEFIFHSCNKTGALNVSKELKDDFFFIHSDRNMNTPNVELQYWLKSGRLKTDGIPVFYKIKAGELHSIGLAMMYRLAFDNRVCDLVPEEHNEKERPDLADIIFGSIYGKSLKGRVQFCHAFAETAEPMDNLLIRVLGSPKASYVPTYLQGGGTYLQKYPEAKLRGPKRYPVHPSGDKDIRGNEGTQTTHTKFCPLKKGAEFLTKIRFHNLRKAEIGALLSALTFHGYNEKELFHSLGMAKALGCGKLQVTVQELTIMWPLERSLNCENHHEYLEAFTKSIEEYFQVRNEKFKWVRQPQIDELLTMAHEQNNRPNTESELKSMTLDPDKSINEFTDARNNGECQKSYSQIDTIQRISLRDVQDFKEEIESYLDQNKIKVIKDIVCCSVTRQALADVLAVKDYNQQYNNLYKIVQCEPSVILLLLEAKQLSQADRKKRLLDCTLNKKDEAWQNVFNWLLENDTRVEPDDVPAWAQPLAYGWEDLGLNEGDLFDFIEDLNKTSRVWPPMSSLPDFIGSFKFTDPDNREYCELALEEFNDT